MIEIITGDGISLDIDPSTEFEIEIENPMLSDSHIPIAFSTSIAFLPTAKNKKAFGYMAAMLQEPKTKQLKASIHAGGIPLFYGRLEYDGIEDGKLNYTFAGRDIEDEWSGYIHELKHLSEPTFPNESYGSIENDKKYKEMLQVQEGTMEADYALPMLINQDSITEMEHDSSSSMTTGEHYDILEIKYHNYYWGLHHAPVTPAVKVSSILSKVLERIEIDTDILPRLQKLAILALHRSRPLCNHGLQQNGDRKLFLPIADMLPECSIYNLLTNILKMYCSVMFRDGQSFVIKSCNSVLLGAIKHIWDEKINSNITLTKEPRSSYTFTFSNDDDNAYKPDSEESENSEDFDIIDVWGLKSVIEEIEKSSTDYISIRDNKTKDMYSGKSLTVKRASNTATLPSVDILLHHLSSFSPEKDEEQSFDNTVDFKCVKCLPLHHAPFLIDNTAYHLCPIVKPSAAGENRSTDVIIGCLLNGQLVDKGTAFVNGSNNEGSDENCSIDPDALFQKYHTLFKQWLSKERKIISADVALSLPEIASLRMYDKISISNQSFLIKKISHSFSALSDTITSKVDLIEYTTSIKDTVNYIWIEHWQTVELGPLFHITSQNPVASDVVVRLSYTNLGNEQQNAILRIIRGGTNSNTVNGTVEISRVVSGEEVSADAQYTYILEGVREVDK